MILPRSSWTGVARPTSKLTRMTPSQVKGFAVHYTGSTGALGDHPTEQLSARRIRDEYKQHVQQNGWTDIAYQAAVDQAGRVWDLRGVDFRSAANGDAPLNQAWGAITVLIGTDDVPTQAAIDAVRWWRNNVWLARYPNARKIVGHRDLHSTLCPGDRLYRLVASGAFLEQPAPAPAAPVQPAPAQPATTPGEDDMPLSDTDVRRIADELLSADARYQVHVPGVDPAVVPLPVAVARLWQETRAQGAALLSADSIATAVAARYPQAPDVATLAKAIADEISTRLVR